MISRVLDFRDSLPAIPLRLRPPVGVAAVLAATVLSALTAVYVSGHRLWPSDGVEGPAAAGLARVLATLVDALGEPVGAAIVLPLLAVVCWLRGRRRLAVLAMAGPLLTVGVTSLLKPLTGRMIHGDNLAFPSGHTGMFTAVGLIGGLLVAHHVADRRAAAVVVLGSGLLCGVAMGWAQTVLVSHFMTDTVGGLCAAMVVVPVAGWAVDRLTEGT
ncbi:hypothetical protein [Thermocrispum municipale]|uniref:hypothetical protein n=1 Tax=Thermocrispum municipale TaxID=37926 RepID=UPI0004000336|nr:hypothetical protein [Thermocrispum municipale]